MRILCINDYGYRVGGAEVFAREMADRLQARGHEVRWLTSRSRGGGPLAVVDPDTRPFHDDWFCAGANGPWRGVHQAINLSARRTLGRALREWRPDVVHLHGYLGRLSPAILRPLATVPTVATLHNYRALCPKGTKQRADGGVCETRWGVACVGCARPSAIAQEAVKRALWGSPVGGIRRLLAPSRFMQAVTARETGRPVEYFPNGTDAHARRLPKRDGPPAVLFVGRLVAGKGLAGLITATALIPDARLVIAGAGPERARFARMAHERVTFVGEVDRARVAELHAEARVMALPATWPENAPVTILEAFAFGTPVVTTDVGGARELVRDGREGLLVPPGQPDALAAALRAILHDEARRRAMQAQCLVRAEEYRWELLIPRLETVYRETIARS